CCVPRFCALPYSDPPVLPPFPTRCSSDLQAVQLLDHVLGLDGPIGILGVLERMIALPAPEQIEPRLTIGNLSIAPRLDELFDNRSEEHTSELQSRENLVCRLHLEKKKHET